MTDIRFQWSGLEGSIVGYSECTSVTDFSSQNAKNSLSLTRESNSKADATRGRAGHMPFTPGGLQTIEDEKKSLHLSRDENGLYNIPPGLSRGILEEVSFKETEDVEDEEFVLSENVDKTPEEMELEELEDAEDDMKEEIDVLEALDIGKSDNNEPDSKQSSGILNLAEIDELLPNEITFGRIQNTGTVIPKAKDWAHVVDVNKKITNFEELVPSMAKEYPFELDTFQKEAVYHLEQGDSVFVAAHTSAGKTVVAEYAIAMAVRNMTKAIYTSPIKALSNQKFRDFQDIFDDVGILTGDVQINSEASCLIMTTEILRSMLYRGADLIRDVEFVIFDEVHYVNDQDRGVVWEEVIIMLPEHIKLILLSATVPNTFEFANWVGRTKQKDIYVISTPKRPVPLEHFIWAKTEQIKIVNSEKKFLIEGYQSVKNVLAPPVAPTGPASTAQGGRGGRGGRGGARGGGRGGRGGGQLFNSNQRNGGGGNRFNNNTIGKTQFQQLLAHLKKNTLLPAVVFVFSQKRASQYATMLTSIDYTTAAEKSQIRVFVSQAVSRLRKEDRELPQIQAISDMLVRGIGVHHGGLLPIIKEIVEILFAKTLVKVLFATETFAMGLNLPTKTVVFSSIRKFDGHDHRNLLPGEYTQMAGRAGRRGLDSTGTVIIMASPNDDALESQESIRELILGTATKLKSQFRLTYNMILNLLRIEALRVEEMIKRSFSENTNQVMLPEHQKNVKINEALLESLKREPCSFCDQDMEETLVRIDERAQLSREIFEFYTNSSLSLSAFSRGRIVVVKLQDGQKAVGVIMRVEGLQAHIYIVSKTKGKSAPTDNIPYFSTIPGYCERNFPNYFTLASKFKLIVLPVASIELIVRIQMKTPPSAFAKPKTSKSYKAAIDELILILQFQNKWNEFHKTIRSVDFSFKDNDREKLMQEIAASNCIKCPNFVKHYSIDHEKFVVRQNIDSLKLLISNENMELLPDYEQRIEVLKELNYIDEEQNVLLKGRVACEISTGFELIITELVLDNFLASYEPEEIVSLLSVFLFQGNQIKESDMPPTTITPKLDFGRQKIIEVVTKVMNVFEKYSVLVTQEEAEFLETNRFELMEPIYEWGRGMFFKDIMKITEVPEGTIVRVISRLDEVCRQVMNAARIIGDATLYEKMTFAQEKIKRDIVFCASLYL